MSSILVIPPDEGTRPRYGVTSAALADMVANTGIPGRFWYVALVCRPHPSVNMAWNFTCLSHGRKPLQNAVVRGQSLKKRVFRNTAAVFSACPTFGRVRRTSQLLKIW